MEAHSKIGASSMERWSVCPGSVVLSEGVPRTNSVYSELGTAAHAFGEWILENKLPLCFEQDKYFTYEDHGVSKVAEITEEMYEAVQVYVGYVRDILAQNPDAELYLEEKFNLEAIHLGLFGTGDCVLWIPRTKTLHVIDYKHGKGKAVTVTGNKQLKYYAVGAVFKLTHARPETITTTIVQPRCKHKDGAIRSEQLSIVELLEWAVTLRDDAVKVQEATDNYKIDNLAEWTQKYLEEGAHCWWCPAKQCGKCPIINAKKQADARSVFGEIKSV